MALAWARQLTWYQSSAHSAPDFPRNPSAVPQRVVRRDNLAKIKSLRPSCRSCFLCNISSAPMEKPVRLGIERLRLKASTLYWTRMSTNRKPMRKTTDNCYKYYKHSLYSANSFRVNSMGFCPESVSHESVCNSLYNTNIKSLIIALFLVYCVFWFHDWISPT